jgi:hypothetical protein
MERNKKYKKNSNNKEICGKKSLKRKKQGWEGQSFN